MATARDQHHNRTAKQPPKIVYKVVNPIMRGLLSSPLHGLLSSRLILLSFTGRNTGNQYTTPVGYARAGDTLYTGTERPWSRNLRGGAPVQVTLRGQRRKATAEVISDLIGMSDAYREIYAASPGYARALTQSGGVAFDANGDVIDEDVVRARDAGHVVIRLTLDADR